MVYVVKVGGSLLAYPKDLKKLCGRMVSLAEEFPLMVVPGGGMFADAVRTVYRRLKISDDLAHKMAVRAMDQYGLVLGSLMIGRSIFVANAHEAIGFASNGLVAILQVSQALDEDDSLPRSWDVTSDSIAAYIAIMVKAEALILAKSVDGVKALRGENASAVCEKVSVRQLLGMDQSVVDRYLPRVLEKGGVKCFVLNGRFPDRVEAVLRLRKTLCTEIVKDSPA